MLKYFIALTLVVATTLVLADELPAVEAAEGEQLVAKKHEKRGLASLGYNYDAPLGYNSNYNSGGYNRLVSPIAYSRGGGYSDYTNGGYNLGYNTGYNTGYSGLGNRYTSGGYTTGLGGYNGGLSSTYGTPYTSANYLGNGYSSLGGYSTSGLGGYSGGYSTGYSGLGGYSGYSGTYPNTRAAYVAPLASTVYNPSSGYYY